MRAVSYGATYGSIVGDGGKNENNAPATDVLISKQATKQGSIEGSLAGTSLAVGASEENIDEANLRSRSSIVKAAATSNSLAASNANSAMATKAIKTSTADMLLLMKKFNINPRLTNPTRVFKPKVIRNEEQDLPFEEKLQVATPI